MSLNLANLKNGEEAQLVEIGTNCSSKNRLTELGFTKGVLVKVLRKAIAGDPIEVMVRGTRYALRKSDAETISMNTL